MLLWGGHSDASESLSRVVRGSQRFHPADPTADRNIRSFPQQSSIFPRMG